MKMKLLSVSFFALLLSLCSFSFVYESVIAKEPASDKKNSLKQQNTTTVNLNNSSKKEEKVLTASERAKKFYEEYPYETSRFILLCHTSLAGEVGFFVKASGSNNREIIVQDYFRTSEPLPKVMHENTKNIKGVGVRFVSEIISQDGKIDANLISSLFSLDGNFTKVSGIISVEVFGLGGRNISRFVNIPSNLTPLTISNAQRTIADIRNILIEYNKSEPDFTELSIAPMIIPPLKFDKDSCK